MEIKLKAFDKTTNTMASVVGFRDLCTKNTYAIWFIGFGSEKLYCEVKKENIEFLPFTGIIDKNNSEIYVGDIVKHFNDKCDPEHYEIGAIVFDKSRAAFKKKDSSGALWTLGDHCQYEVIGNIYQNKELAKQNNLV